MMTVKVLHGGSGKWDATISRDEKVYRVGGGHCPRGAEDVVKVISRQLARGSFDWNALGGGYNYEVDVPEDVISSKARRWAVEVGVDADAIMNRKLLSKAGINPIYAWPVGPASEGWK